MGLTISNLLQKFFDKKHVKILMLGLDGAGKTSILYSLKLGEIVTTTPTIGFNVETVIYDNVSFTVWDIGGQEKTRQLWRFYFDNVQGLIYVVDCSDTERIRDAAKELVEILEVPQLSNAVLLIYANKQDLPTAITSHELGEQLGLSKLLPVHRKLHIQPSIANKSQGIYEGLDWLSHQISTS